MKKRILQLTVVFTAVLGVLLASMGPAGATSDSNTYNVKKDTTVSSTLGHTITVGGSNIYFKKTDGPQVEIRWYKCGYTGTHGSYVTFANPDPTSRQLLDYDFLSGTVFCLQLYSEGNNSTDTVTGTSYWNVNS